MSRINEHDLDNDDDLIENIREEDIVDLTTTTSTTAAQPPHFRDDPLTVFRFIPPGRIIFIEDCCRRDYERSEYSSHFFPRSPSTEKKHRVHDWHTVPGTLEGRLSDNLGSWKNDGTKNLYYSTSHKASREIKLKPSSEEDAKVLVNRYLYVYPKTPSFLDFLVPISIRMYIITTSSLILGHPGC